MMGTNQNGVLRIGMRQIKNNSVFFGNHSNQRVKGGVLIMKRDYKMMKFGKLTLLLITLLACSIAACDKVTVNPAPPVSAKTLPEKSTLHLSAFATDSLWINLYDSLGLGPGYSVSGLPTKNGVLKFDGTANRFLYIPSGSFSGTDSLQFKLCNTNNACKTVNVLVQVSPACNSVFVGKKIVIDSRWSYQLKLIDSSDFLCEPNPAITLVNSVPAGVQLSINGFVATIRVNRFKAKSDTVWFNVTGKRRIIGKSYFVITHSSCDSLFEAVPDTLSYLKRLPLSIPIRQGLLQNDIACDGTLDSASFNYVPNNDKYFMRINTAKDSLVLYLLKDTASTEIKFQYSYRNFGGNLYRLANVLVKLR